MANKMGYYNVEDYTKQKRQQGKDAKIPPKPNFLAAANHMRQLFEGKKFTYGIMGGLAMLCLGHRREMPDLQIAYNDKDFHRIKIKLEADQRVRLPEGINSLFPAKCLIRTGPAYKDEGCTQAADIEVDLVPPGAHGTPPTDNLATNLVLLSLRTEGKPISFKGLNMLHLVKSLVHSCRVTELAWDPRNDILFLCQHYGEEILPIRNQLDQKAVQQNFLSTPFVSQLSPEHQRQCYAILLGTNPPPIMAITPPPTFQGHKQSASTSDIVFGPRLSSHRSSPSFTRQISPELLSPPLPSKVNARRQRLESSKHQPSKLPKSHGAQVTAPLKSPNAMRDSRSRYRPVSVPHSGDIGPTDYLNATPKSTNMPPLPSHAEVPAHQSLHSRAQQHWNYQPQAPLHLAPAPMAAQGRRSMPNLNPGLTGPVQPYAFSQKPMLNGFTPFLPQLQNYMSLVELSATPAPLNPGQQHMKSQLGLGGHDWRSQQSANSFPITERPVPPRIRASIPQQSVRAELSGTPMPETHRNQLHLVSGNGEAIINTQPEGTDLGISSKLRLVDSERLYQASEGALVMTQSVSNNDHTIVDNASQAPVELDATSQLGQFIVELSVERCTPAPEQDDDPPTHRHPQGQSQSFSDTRAHGILSTSTAVRDSPVSPPDSDLASVTTQTQHQGMLVRPLNTRTQSAPLAALPTSLMAGGANPYRRLPSNSIPHPPATTPAQVEPLITNASRYTRYYASQTPPSSTSNSRQASPQPAPVSAYKAYHLPAMALSPPSLPLSPPESQISVATLPERPGRLGSFATLKDVDGANGYFRTHPGHKRDTSHDSNTSGASHDSSKLAQEYQAELPGYGEGYGL